MKRVWTILAGLVGLLALGAATSLWWAWTEDRPADYSANKIFRIAAGEPLGVTAQRLASERLVRNAQIFRWLVQLGPSKGSMPSGTFAVPGGLSARDAADWFRHARPVQVRVTVPEGLTSRKVALLLEAKGVAKAAEVMNLVDHPALLGAAGAGLTTLDGRLFPDTYQFDWGTPAVDVVRTLVETFAERTKPWANRNPEEFAQRLVLASIVEREYRVADEAPIIASVFVNRLEHQIALGSCATIEYILTEIQGRPHPKRIFLVHTQIESPYNTYLHKGLPPGPIANPGLTALRAAFEPATTDYLYFVVADPVAGRHTFSTRYDQHEKAREAYLATFVSKG